MGEEMTWGERHDENITAFSTPPNACGVRGDNRKVGWFVLRDPGVVQELETGQGYCWSTYRVV